MAASKTILPVDDGTVGPSWGRSTRRIGMWLLVLLAAGAALAYLGRSFILGPVVSTSIVRKENIVLTVVASGLVRTPYRIDVGSKIIGVVIDVPVEEGQTVAAGDLLIRLDDTQARKAVETANASVAQARAKLDQLQHVAAPVAEEMRRQAEANLVDAQAAYRRAFDPARRGFETDAALDAASRALNIALSQSRAAEIQVASNKPGGRDFIVAQTLVTQTEAQRDAAETALEDSRIFAARAGTLITRDVERGDTVQPGKVLMVLAPHGVTEIVAPIDEQNLGLIRVGETAAVSADAFPDLTFAATVSYINPAVQAQSGSVEVKLTVPDPPAHLRQDMTVSVEIEVARKAAVLSVDVDDIHDPRGPDPYVLIVENGKVHRQPVRIGLLGDTAAEIVDGLQPGTRIVSGAAPRISDGHRVRIESGA